MDQAKSMTYTIKQIEEMLEKITRSRWSVGFNMDKHLIVQSMVGSSMLLELCSFPNRDTIFGDHNIEENSRFIAAAPAIVRQLLEKIETLKELLELQRKESWKEELKLQNVALEQENEELKKMVEALYQVGLKNAR